MPKLLPNCWFPRHQLVSLRRLARACENGFVPWNYSYLYPMPYDSCSVTLLGFKMELLMNPFTLPDGDLHAIRCTTETLLLRGGEMLLFTENFEN
jgi:hypothetical protein